MRFETGTYSSWIMDRSTLSLEERQTSFFRRKEHWLVFVVTALLWILSLAVIWYAIGKRETVIVLHYNVYFGIDALGLWWQAFFIPLSGIGIWLVHILLSWRCFRGGEYALSRIALLSLFFLESMVLIVSLTVSLVNY